MMIAPRPARAANLRVPEFLMYVPEHFEEARAEELLRTIEAHPLGALIVNGPQGLDANHVPFLVDATNASCAVSSPG